MLQSIRNFNQEARMSDKPEESTEKPVEEKKPDATRSTRHDRASHHARRQRNHLHGHDRHDGLEGGSEKTGDKAGEAEGEKPKATVFFVAYTLKDVDDTAQRPITFSFNGGPGSSSVWLHLGALGPRRVVMTEEGQLPPPPYRLTDNAYSLLDQTDLVFIDPMLTGYSRPVAGEKAKDFLTSRKTSNRWAISSGCIPRVINAGYRPSS